MLIRNLVKPRSEAENELNWLLIYIMIIMTISIKSYD